MKRTTLLFAVCCALLTLPVGAADWLQFRRPHSSGVSEEKGLPVSWGDKENVAWKVELPGPGASSPVISGDKVLSSRPSTRGLDRPSSKTGGPALAGPVHLAVTSGGISAAHLHHFSDARNNEPRNGLALGKNAPWLVGPLT
jgi:hypothetical protein